MFNQPLGPSVVAAVKVASAGLGLLILALLVGAVWKLIIVFKRWKRKRKLRSYLKKQVKKTKKRKRGAVAPPNN